MRPVPRRVQDSIQAVYSDVDHIGALYAAVTDDAMRMIEVVVVVNVSYDKFFHQCLEAETSLEKLFPDCLFVFRTYDGTRQDPKNSLALPAKTRII